MSENHRKVGQTKVTIDRPVGGSPDAPPLFVDEAFPPYRFVPGLAPHPFAHEGGWGYGKERPAPPLMDPGQWAENAAYLRGCDFFNRGWWWEAHEAWEDLWHVVEGHHPRQWQMLKGLIQLAACALQRERGVDKGAQRLLASAVDCLEQSALVDGSKSSASSLYCGLDLKALANEAQLRLSAPSARIDGFYLRPAPTPPVSPITDTTDS